MLERRKLLKLVWHVTNRCNFNCTYCYVVVNRYHDDMPTSKMLEIADKINATEIQSVQFTGGEVFTRGDMLPIMERLSDRISIGVATNGSLITPKTAEYLASRDVFTSITVDSLDDATNRSTRVGSDTPLLLRNLKLLVKSGVRTGVSSVVSNTNSKTLAEMAEYFFNLGAVSWKANILRNAGEALESSTYGGLALDYQSQETLLRQLYELRLKYKPLGFNVVASTSPYPGYFETFAKDKDRAGSCFCGYTKVDLKFDGGLVPCDGIKYPDDYTKQGFEIPNILDGRSLQEIFRDSKLLRLWSIATSGVVPIGCNDCAFFENCRGMCRGEAMVRQGSPAGLLGFSTGCARNNKIRAESRNPLRLVGQPILPSAR